VIRIRIALEAFDAALEVKPGWTTAEEAVARVTRKLNR